MNSDFRRLREAARSAAAMNLPTIKIPNLVAFNHRVRRRLDPWFERTWVKRAAWTLFGGLMLMAVVFVVFARNIPSSDKLLAYQPPLPTNVRGYDGNPVQTFARER